MTRDFTFIDDLIESLVRLIDVVPVAGGLAIPGDSLSPVAPWRIVNIGRGEPLGLMDFVAAIEKQLGKKAIINMKPMQPGDVVDTNAKTDLLDRLIGYRPSTSIDVGIGAFVDWYKSYSRD